MIKSIRLGTRNSQLALIQAKKVQSLLEKRLRLTVSICPIQTQGDRDQESCLKDLGGRGVFVRCLEHALERKEIDIAVHSLKDVTTKTLDSLQMCSFLKTESPKDALLLKKGTGDLDHLPSNFFIATGSMRRQALLKELYPHLKTCPVRGNVPTRIEKLERGLFQGLILSHAGLLRLSLERYISHVFDPKVFIPAPGQGVIALQARKKDKDLCELCQKIGSSSQRQLTDIEMRFLSLVGFDCTVPLGLHAYWQDSKIALTVFVSDENLQKFFRKTLFSPPDQALKMSENLAQEVLLWLEKN